jgi:hypothetical protein
MPKAANSNKTPTTTVQPSQHPEFEAQRMDAERELSASIGEGETLHIYQLVPTAEPDDPNWVLAPSHGKMKVVAKTAGDARVLAAAYEFKFMAAPFIPGNAIATMEASAFRNDRLYTVIEISADIKGLPRGILSDTPVA